MEKHEQAFLDLMGREGSRPRSLLLDMDEVLVNISPKWIQLCFADEEIAKCINYGVFEGVDAGNFVQHVLGRDEYYFTDWMGLEGDIAAKAVDLYFNNPNYYDNLPITPFGRSIQMILDNQGVENIFIVSHTRDGKAINDSKVRWVKKQFPSAKVKLFMVDSSVKKSKVVVDQKIEFDTFVDDGLWNIRDVMTMTGTTGKEFMLPRLGYNKADDELVALANQHEAKLGYYARVA